MFRYPALMPLYPFIDEAAPKNVKGVRMIDDNGRNIIVWINGNKAAKNVMNAPHSYVVYRFAQNENRTSG
jgi:hypothetical protein